MMAKEYIKDEMSGLEYVPLCPQDTFEFICRRCGACCRKVKSAIPLEPLDVYRLVKHFKDPVEDVIETYMDVELLVPNFPILFLKTKSAQDECIFFRDGRCSVYTARPRTCRMYPLSSGPDETGGIEHMWVAKEHHQYSPGTELVGDWMDRYLSAEDREFLLMEYGFTKQLGFIFSFLPKEPDSRILTPMLIYRYFAYYTDEDFLPQYWRNMLTLITELKWLAENHYK